ncbi:uncharacterized protein LOC130681302 isoform X2 [Manis pentadactyla]|uniref:uncharacterized protein LOC130681302 isoform X2 n=1 Tax=Manis pentadactyla TaxID=143292 RepID=UPI00255D0A86|nr:uncharacterized protein LOC130681302 isoform X2 [Manis pentadactyla]
MSVLNPGWPCGGESHTPGEPGPSTNSDSNPGPPPEEDPEDTSAQVVGVLPFPLRPTCCPSFGPPISTILEDPEVLDVDTSQASKWPGLRSLLQRLPPQDRDVGVESYSSCGHPRQASKLLAFWAALKVGCGESMPHFLPGGITSRVSSTY